MAEVKLQEVDKVYPNGFHAVKDLSLDVEDGEFLVLVGPSGCGKTTALRMVAGLETITDGEVSIGGRVVNQMTPKDRDIAMVFQSYALYPHLSVADNIAFGLRLRRTPKHVVEERTAWAARMLDLTPYLDRKPKQLSGGQRQRVAMGRAIVREPKVFLMDEPLSNLDAKLRVQMRGEIAKLQHDLGTTTIYVTHDQVEAMTMGHRVAVMHQGALQQIDGPQRLYDEPANLFVAGFIGTPPMNIFAADLRVAEGRVTVSLDGQELPVPDRALERYRALASYNGRSVAMGIRSEDLHPADQRPELPRITARLELIEALGSETMAFFRIDARTIRSVAAATGDAVEEVVGDEGIAAARPNLVAAFPPRVALADRGRRRGGRGRRARPFLRRGDRSSAPLSPATGLRRGGARSWALACVALVAAVAVGTAVGAPAPTPAPPSGAELARLSAPPTRGPLASQRIYFVMTDRYANGDPSNDRGGKTGARTVTGFDPADAGWFHGGDFAGLRGSCTGAADGLARIADLGFTAVWITPPFGQRTVQGDSAGYHGYWITDFTAPDRHLGTEQEFGALVDLRPLARAEGDPRRRRQPHGRRRLAHRRQRRLHRARAGAVPRLPRQAVPARAVRRQAVPVHGRAVHAARAARRSPPTAPRRSPRG